MLDGTSVIVAAIGWLVILTSAIVFDLMSSRYRLDVANNLAARRTQTQIQMLHRIVVLIVSIVTLSVMLMTFPAIKHIGISLLASAGLAGLVIGSAMNRTISNLIAGVQIAFTQPMQRDWDHLRSRCNQQQSFRPKCKAKYSHPTR